MGERAERIINAAVELAEEGGFQNVRLRDVAQRSGVAFGTLYARFASKEDILVAALQRETKKFEELLDEYPVEGPTAVDRGIAFFGISSRALFDRPGFGKAVLKSLGSGVETTAAKVISYQDMMTGLIIGALRGPRANDDEIDADKAERIWLVAHLLLDIWYGELVQWMSASTTEEQLLETISKAVHLLVGTIKEELGED